ncbi:MAG: DUF2179 domain-containing protein [Planctomycetes bacterium]|nr:DUF2179 domain-containing protein [Planctomycetota bacterium]
MPTAELILTALLIMVARMADVALGTFRFVLVINGRRALAWLIAFLEAGIWVFAASKVLTHLNEPLYAIAFSLGFATGTFLGMTIERAVAMGEQVLRIFTAKGEAVADGLRSRGFRVTSFEGKGRDGRVDLLFIQVHRREAVAAAVAARVLDPDCFYVVDDVRFASAVKRSTPGASLRK